MAEKIFPEAVPNDAHLNLVLTLTGNPLSVAILDSDVAKDITYAFTDDGWDNPAEEATVEDNRLSLPQTLQLAGRTTESLTVKYVFGSEDDVMRETFVAGLVGNITARYAVPYAMEFAAAQLVDVIHFRAGRQQKVAPVANGRWQMQQKLFIIKPTDQDQALVA